MWKIASLIISACLLSGCGGDAPNDQSALTVHGTDFGPYVAGQAPPDNVSADQLTTRMQVIASCTHWVRSYSCTSGLEEIGRIAHDLGLKAAVGAWLGDDLAKNEEEIANLIAEGKAGNVDIAVVGSEVLLALGKNQLHTIDEAKLIEYINRVKAELPDTPVTTADTAQELLGHPEVVAACDLVFFNYYSYWEGLPVDQAVDDIAGVYDQLVEAYPGKKVAVSETGWPAKGDQIGAAVPSPENQRAYFERFVRWAASRNVEYFWFEASNEEWKAPPAQEANWGMFGVELTHVPPVGSTENLRGRAWARLPVDCRVAVYIRVAGGWYNKPAWAVPATPIAADGTWNCDITTHANDLNATDVAAYLVPADYEPYMANGDAQLPLELETNSLARVVAARQE